MLGVKQLITRIDADLHARLKEKAAEEGLSVNALVTEVLEHVTSACVDGRAQLDRRATERGIRLVPTRAVGHNPPDRDALIKKTRGLGAFIDRELDEDRGPRER